MMPTSPTQRSLAHARRLGYTVAITEHWNPFARRRVDLFGAFDLVAVREGDRGPIGIQTTSGGNHASRVRKLVENPAVRTWLLSGGKAEVWSWCKRGGRWDCRRQPLTLEDFDRETVPDLTADDPGNPPA